MHPLPLESEAKLNKLLAKLVAFFFILTCMVYLFGADLKHLQGKALSDSWADKEFRTAVSPIFKTRSDLQNINDSFQISKGFLQRGDFMVIKGRAVHSGSTKEGIIAVSIDRKHAYAAILKKDDKIVRFGYDTLKDLPVEVSIYFDEVEKLERH